MRKVYVNLPEVYANYHDLKSTDDCLSVDNTLGCCHVGRVPLVAQKNVDIRPARHC